MIVGVRERLTRDERTVEVPACTQGDLLRQLFPGPCDHLKRRDLVKARDVAWTRQFVARTERACGIPY